MPNKRKLDDLINSFDNMNIQNKCTDLVVSQPPPAKRGHYLPITVSKLKLKPNSKLIKVNQSHKYKNIFGLHPLPEQETFTREEVEILIDQRERELYKRYLTLMAYENVKEKILPEVHEIS